MDFTTRRLGKSKSRRLIGEIFETENLRNQENTDLNMPRTLSGSLLQRTHEGDGDQSMQVTQPDIEKQTPELARTVSITSSTPNVAEEIQRQRVDEVTLSNAPNAENQVFTLPTPSSSQSNHPAAQPPNVIPTASRNITININVTPQNFTVNINVTPPNVTININ